MSTSAKMRTTLRESGQVVSGVERAKKADQSMGSVGYCELGTKPRDDSGYFEQMTKTVFRAGLNWRVVETKWPNFQRAFAKFSPEKVARYDEAKVQSLMSDQGIVRNQTKIQATIKNAKQFLAIRKEQGSFDAYLEELRHLPEEARCRILAKEFSHIGPSTAMVFLRSVGEEMPKMSQQWMASHDM